MGAQQEGDGGVEVGGGAQPAVDGGREESDSDTVVGDERHGVSRGRYGERPVSSVDDAGSNASPVYERSETSGGEESSGNEFSDEERYQAREEEMEMEMERRWC